MRFTSRRCLWLSLTALALGLATVFSGAAVSGAPAASPLPHFLITDHGAVGDGTTLNTAAIQQTIDAAAAAGGGVVEIPAGKFLSGSLFLKNGVELYLDTDAVLLGSQNIEDYPKRPTRVEGHFPEWRMALVNAQNMSRVRIGGTGQLNGNGAPFWALFYAQRRANPKTTNLDVERPRLVFIDRCQDVRVENVSFQDSGFWNLHMYNCHNVLIEGLHINAPPMTPSTDGMDIDSCQNVTIRHCQISCNDDNIALKGSKGPLADVYVTDGPPVENILIEDCEFGNGNGVITCGSEATIIRNVTVHNCTITGRANLLTLKLRPDTSQHYSNITVDGVKSTGTAGSFFNVAPWTQFYDLADQPAPPPREIAHVTVRNITGNFAQLGSLRGNPDDTLRDITIEDVDINTGGRPLLLGDVEKLTFKNVLVNGEAYDPTKPTEP